MTAYATYGDGELLKFLKNGDLTAFGELYRRYNKELYLYLLGYVKDPVFAEDLAHDVFVRLWEIRGKMNIQSSFSAYLFRVSHNMAVNALKKMAVENRSLGSAFYLQQVLRNSNIQTTSSLVKYDRLLEDALNSLPPQRRKVFVLCRHEGKSYEEVAAELGISRNTVKEHLIKASKNLRAFLADKGEIAMAILVFQNFF